MTIRTRTLSFTRGLFTGETWQITLTLWVFGMIAMPVIPWLIGDNGIPVMSVVTTLLQFSAVYLILQHAWGIRRTVSTFAIIAFMTYSAEFIGSKTGIPFGSYHYTAILQPQFFGVPVIIPLAWFMMLVPAWGIASAIIGQHRTTLFRQIFFVLLSGLAVTAWDLFLDPQMVNWGFWVWHEPSGYFGIPWINFAGWLLTAMSVTLVARPQRMPVIPLLIVYGIVWALQSIGLAVFWAQPGPALCGFLAMGSLLLFAIYSLRKAA